MNVFTLFLIVGIIIWVLSLDTSKENPKREQGESPYDKY